VFKYIDHIAIHIKDIDKVVNFYCDIFGFSIHFENIIPSGHKVVYLILGGTILEINESYKEKISGSHFCIRTDEFDTDYKKLINMGLTLLQNSHNTSPRIPDEKGWQRAVFEGLGGEQIEIRG
jgi:catechol 2,3-dioxygenase-like lactoylglutathione lyase family enzyme